MLICPLRDNVAESLAKFLLIVTVQVVEVVPEPKVVILLRVLVTLLRHRTLVLPLQSSAKLMMLESVKAHPDLPVRVVLDPVLVLAQVLAFSSVKLRLVLLLRQL